MKNLILLPLVLCLACAPEVPTPVEDANIGVAITFPGKASHRRYEESTPYGRLDWFGHAWIPAGRMDESFHVEVANVPPGAPGGRTVPEAIGTFEAWLTARQGRLERVELPESRGPGFQYRVVRPSGHVIAGVLIVRKGRLHHAQATVRKADDPRLKPFLDSFRVLP